MRLYLDTSAFLKLLVEEPESTALVSQLRGGLSGQHMSSILLETEARRAAHRMDLPQADVTTALSGVNLVDAPRSLFAEAGLLAGSTLRTLDALHLATALRHSADVIISYDHHLLGAATSHGLPTASPA
ncbi:type II toxin-antitoxin system VapC family toxin [Nocardioides limicola]|uniref:type II toxin-antitoxin system VapC family toxin n=1 Tax=Nocardioides limicola TaxID=2803368 RepID=UPI00193B4569|nr:type II toxin-antitoxin system VapC family toxin [Nocardioides sp. DJM-14]